MTLWPWKDTFVRKSKVLSRLRSFVFVEITSFKNLYTLQTIHNHAIVSMNDIQHQCKNYAWLKLCYCLLAALALIIVYSTCLEQLVQASAASLITHMCKHQGCDLSTVKYVPCTNVRILILNSLSFRDRILIGQLVTKTFVSQSKWINYCTITTTPFSL